MTGPFELDGYDVVGPLGASQTTWRAVDLADGSRVVLRRVPAAAANVAEIRRRAALWGSLPVRVAAVRDVVAAGEDLVVVTEFAEGGGLEALVAARRALSAGQVVTLVAPLAETLAVAHACGFVHGRVHARNILLDDAGRPLLTDCVFGAGGDARSDIAALAGLALGLLGDDGSAGLLAMLRAAASPRSGEMSAADLGQAVLTAAPAQPLLVTPPATAAAVPNERAPLRGRTTAAVAAVAVLVAVFAGAVWRRDDTATGAAAPVSSQRARPATPEARATSSPARPQQTSFHYVVRRLEAQRQLALAAASPRLLAHVDLPGTTLWHRDRRVVAALRAGNAHAIGVRAKVLSVRVLHGHDSTAVVRVVDELSSYDVVAGSGVLLAHHQRRAARAMLVALTKRDGRWLISRVTPRWR